MVLPTLHGQEGGGHHLEGGQVAGEEDERRRIAEIGISKFSSIEFKIRVVK